MKNINQVCEEIATQEREEKRLQELFKDCRSVEDFTNELLPSLNQEVSLNKMNEVASIVNDICDSSEVAELMVKLFVESSDQWKEIQELKKTIKVLKSTMFGTSKDIDKIAESNAGLFETLAKFTNPNA